MTDMFFDSMRALIHRRKLPVNGIGSQASDSSCILMHLPGQSHIRENEHSKPAVANTHFFLVYQCLANMALLQNRPANGFQIRFSS
jgi:hypothetical protein